MFSQTHQHRTKHSTRQRMGFFFVWAFVLSGCNIEGVCTVGDDTSCPSGAFCYGGKNEKPGNHGICVQREAAPADKLTDKPELKGKPNDMLPDVLAAKVKAWQLIVGQTEVKPLHDEGSATSNPDAGWVGLGEARVEALVSGLKPGEELKAWAGHGVNAACKPEGVVEEGGEAQWTCTFAEGWTFQEPEAEFVEVRLRPGEGVESARIFRADMQEPIPSLLVFVGTPCRLGEDSACPKRQICVEIPGNADKAFGVCRSGCRVGSTTATCHGNEVCSGDNGSTPNGTPSKCVRVSCSGLKENPCSSGRTCVDFVNNEVRESGSCETPCENDEECDADEICEVINSNYPNSKGCKPGCRADNENACFEGQVCRNTDSSSSRLMFECVYEYETKPESIVTACAQAKDIQGDMLSIQTKAPVAMSGEDELDMAWEQAGKTDLASLCWSGVLPPEITNSRALSFSMSAEARSKAGNLSVSTIEGGIERMSCGTQVAQLSANAVRTPLAFANGSLVFGSSGGAGATPLNNALYFFDVWQCALIKSLHTGALQGPMVALGGTGEIALALGGGGPLGRNTPRLATVSTTTGQFTSHVSFECVPGQANSASNATFEQGLSLMGIGETDMALGAWSFVAPANAGSDTVLMAYAPYRPGLATTCLGSPKLPHPFGVPLSQTADKTLLGIYGSLDTGFFQREWRWNFESFAWTVGTPKAGIFNPPFLAIVDESIWVNEVPANTSPAAIDAEGRAYAVVAKDGEHRLQRFATGSSTPQTSSIPLGSAPVGSPMLGDAFLSPEKVYVVTTNGTVLAFEAESLKLLWRQSLGIRISSTAQPVLGPGTLWVVGKRGEVRGLHVDSLGLSTTAQWPKAFHDNCNTSSRQVTESNMQSCFSGLPDMGQGMTN